MANSHGRFVWYELLTTDTEAAKAFYSGVMGWNTRETAAAGGAFTLFSAGDTPVAALMKLPEEAKRLGAGAHWSGYVGVDDVDACVARVQELGGKVYVPPTEIPQVSRFAVVADPQMAPIGVIKGQRSEEAQPGDLTTLQRIGWHELLASDWKKAFDFYSDLFGWQKGDSHTGIMGAYQQFSVAGSVIGGMFTKPPTLPFAFWLYYFNVDDIGAAAKRVEDGGGHILYGPTEVPGGSWVVHCTDPQGAIFALIDRRPRKPVGYFVPRNSTA